MQYCITLAIFTTVCSVVAQAQPQTCPRSCRCDSRRNVYCNERKISIIPYGIPLNTKTLHLQINNIANGPTTDEILSGLRSLTKLDLHRNRLTSVPRGLPSSLECIYFRNNRMKYVGKMSLRGLTLLRELHLDENNITNQGLSPLAFQDTHRLQELVLSNNLLTAFPEDLPISLRVLRLDNNHITTISLTSMSRLSNLNNLDLSNNLITQKGIAFGAMGSMISLQTLDMSYNRFKMLPKDLPRNLERLLLSNNKIEYLYESEEHGSLRRLLLLRTVDFSSNDLKSVEQGAFSYLNLRSVELQNNPWQCDCHLRYLKEWLLSTESALSSESHIRCSTPSAFSDVTLNSIDMEALTCSSRMNTKDMMKVVDITSTGFQLQWTGSVETPDPPFVKRSIMYGLLKCKNCSFESALASQSMTGDATSFMENYSSQDITDEVQSNPRNASVFVGRLEPSSHYAVCVFDSHQDDSSISITQCLDVWTSEEVVDFVPFEEDIVFLPLWLIILCCGLVLLIFFAIAAAIIWKKRNTLKTKTPRMYSNRDELYFPDAYLPGFSRPVGYRPTLPQSFGTGVTDRTYAECGPASTAQRTVRDNAVDARMEFDMLLKPDDNSSSRMRVPTPSSSCSDFQESNTMSTTQTGRCSNNDQSVSPPPTYDSLHSYYTPMDQRPNVGNGPERRYSASRLPQESGSLV